MTLAELLPASLFGFLLVFSRVGTLFMVLPTIGESFVSPLIRLSAALLTAGVLTPVLEPTLPRMPSHAGALVILIAGETLIGLFVGGLARLIMSGLQVAGTIIATQTSLATGQQFDPTQGTQGTLVANLLSMTGLAVIFAADLHLVLIGAAGESYRVFPAGRPPMLGDLAMAATATVAASFKMALQIGAPIIVYSLVFYLGLGAVNRLMAQLQVFFVAQPLQILTSFMIIALTLGAVYAWFADYFGEALMAIRIR
jgi:flagellar biosynthetic protein FliR